MPGNPNPNTSNLKPWKPGQSGNPNGRPKGTSLTDRLRKIIDESEEDVAGALMRAGVKAALKGDFRFWKEIYDRCDGKVPDKIDTGDSVIRIVFEDDQAEKQE